MRASSAIRAWREALRRDLLPLAHLVHGCDSAELVHPTQPQADSGGLAGLVKAAKIISSLKKP